MKSKKQELNIKNRKASFDYIFIRDLSAGIILTGSEVKAIRIGKVSLVDSYCYFNEKGELFVKSMNIAEGKTSYTHEPLRERKLLLNRKELDKLQRDLVEGTTIIVKKLFTNENNLIKVEISLVRGKKNYDKREALKKKDSIKEIKSNE